MKSNIFCIFVFIFSVSVQAETVTEVKLNATSPVPTELSDESRASGMCKALTNDQTKMNDCVEWRKNNFFADKALADGRCGGEAQFNKNQKTFNVCAKAQQELIQQSRAKAEDKCGGFDAYKSNPVDFNACLSRNISADGSLTLCKSTDAGCIPNNRFSCEKRKGKWKKGKCEKAASSS